MLHLQVISISTKQVMKMLINNPSFDLMQEMWNGLPLLRRMSYGVNKSMATVLQMFQPLRMDKPISDHIEFALKITKPTPDSYYFGLLVANSTVVGIFKSKPTVIVRPADIAVIMTFLTEHENRLKKRAPCFFNMCVPSMSENYKMSVFFHTSSRNPRTFGLRLAIVTDEASAALLDRFEGMADRLFKQLELEMTITRIKSLEEKMFENQRRCKSTNANSFKGLREIQYMVICHLKLEQFTSYNCLDPHSADLMEQNESALSIGSRQYLFTLRQFERLYE
jgi:hypothetical protein